MNGERTTLPHRLGIVYHSSDSTPVVHYDSCIEEFCVSCLGFPSAWSITSLNKTRLSQKFQQNTRGGTRTLSLLLRRQAPYPLGHTGNRLTRIFLFKYLAEWTFLLATRRIYMKRGWIIPVSPWDSSISHSCKLDWLSIHHNSQTLIATILSMEKFFFLNKFFIPQAIHLAHVLSCCKTRANAGKS